MNQSQVNFREAFSDKDARYAVAEDFLNAYIAAQIKELRGTRSQQDIADAIGTKQSGISRLENVNYSSWKVETLRKLARAFDLRLRISFEEFGTLLPEIEGFNKSTIKRRPFSQDPVFRRNDCASSAGPEEVPQSYFGKRGNQNDDGSSSPGMGTDGNRMPPSSQLRNTEAKAL